MYLHLELQHIRTYVHMYLIFVHGATKCPYCCKYEVQFIPLFRAIRGSVLRSQQNFKQVAQSLDHALLRNWSNLLESVLEGLQTWWDIAVKQNCEISLLGLYLTFINPTLYISVIMLGAKVYTTLPANKIQPSKETYGFHPRSLGFTNRMPARDTVAGVAALTWPISNISLIEGVSGILSLLAKVNTYTVNIQYTSSHTIHILQPSQHTTTAFVRQK